MGGRGGGGQGMMGGGGRGGENGRGPGGVVENYSKYNSTPCLC